MHGVLCTKSYILTCIIFLSRGNCISIVLFGLEYSFINVSAVHEYFINLADTCWQVGQIRKLF